MLFKQELQIRNLHLANRLVLPPMCTHKGDAAGQVTPELLDYYRALTADGLPTLTIVEHCFVEEGGRASPEQLSIAKNEDIPGLTRLADILHKNNSVAILQINHAGGRTKLDTVGGTRVSASAYTCGNDHAERAFTREEVLALPALYAAAARRAIAAGFDGVEIHSAHGYLLNQFYSPLANHREDEFGGDIAGRTRIHGMVAAAVRQAIGQERPLLLRLGGVDYDIPGGSTLQDVKAFAAQAEGWGVDILDLSGGLSGYLRPGHTEPGYFAEIARAARSVTALPLILTGGITEPEQAEALLAEGVADLIGVGRVTLRDKSWIRRALAE